ncbi:MAG: TRAP transporter small permease [Rhodobacteraceae bacterium]|nr:TRAP transporter small permease [Paracoccaceae bacterium]
MRAFHVFATTLSRIAAAIAGLIMTAMTLLMLVEIGLRTLYDRSTFMTEEYVGYGLAASTFLGLAYAMHHGAFLRLDLLLDTLPRRTRNGLIVFGMVLTLGVTAILGNAFWNSASQKFRLGTISDSISQTPLWIPESLVILGLLILALQTVAEIGVLLAGRTGSSRAATPAEILNT